MLMPKTVKLKHHLSSEELESRYRKASDPVLRSHYQIVWLISGGKSTARVVEACLLSNEGVANRYFEEIEELEEALIERCVALCDQPEIIRSHTRYHWWPEVA